MYVGIFTMTYGAQISRALQKYSLEKNLETPLNHPTFSTCSKSQNQKRQTYLDQKLPYLSKMTPSGKVHTFIDIDPSVAAVEK